MECWIGVAADGDRRIVRVAGRLSIAHVPELLEACAAGADVEVDLADLVSADLAGIEALRRLRTRGASIVGAPGYIQLKLDLPSSGPASSPPPGRNR